MILKCIPVGELQTNCYIIADENTREALVVDPGAEGDRILKYITDNSYNVKHIVLTHGHADHISALKYMKEKTGAKVIIHSEDAPALKDGRVNLSLLLGNELTLDAPDIYAKDGDSIEIGQHTFKIIHTPGHTPGGICLLSDKVLISGDTLFLCSIGRTDLPGGNFELLIESIKRKLFILDDDTIVYPGHGDKTTIGAEKGQ